MKFTLIRIFIFLLFYTIEVTVQAQIIKSPEGCTGYSEACVLKNISTQTKSYDFGTQNLRLGSNAVLRIANGEFKLLKGDFLIECLNTCMMSSLFIDRIQVNQGSMYFRAGLKRNVIMGISGDVVHQVNGYGKFVLMPAMVQTVEKGGLKGASTEMPTAASNEFLSSSLEKLSRTPDKLVESIMKVKKSSVEAMSKLSKEMLLRNVASYKQDVHQKKSIQNKYDDESYRLRLLFRKKNSAE